MCFEDVAVGEVFKLMENGYEYQKLSDSNSSNNAVCYETNLVYNFNDSLPVFDKNKNF